MGDPAEASEDLRAELKAELELAHRELTWCLGIREELAENLARNERQRSRLRDQVIALSDALAQSLSAAYWESQSRRTPWGRRTSDEARLVREVEDSPAFDGGWYLRKHSGAVSQRISPAVHYVRRGADRPTQPGPSFSDNAYLAAHPEARTSGLPPLVHAIRHDRVSDGARRVETSAAGTTGDIHL